MDPYELLGVNRTTSFPEVRARYFQLARKHHPDKCSHLSEEEQKANEEYFKNITAAFQKIEQGGCTVPQEEDWRSVWGRVEQLFQRPDVWDCMRTVLQDVVQKTQTNRHKIKVPVSLADLHEGRKKKVQLFLKGVTKPFITTLDCMEYPTTTIEYTDESGWMHLIECEFEVTPHDRYRIDTILGGWDLYMTEEMTWQDYIQGKRIQLESLDGKSEAEEYEIPCFPRMEVPIIISGRGVGGRGDLFIHLEWRAPLHDEWLGLTEDERLNFLNALNAVGRMDPGAPKTKVI
jgi:hypothetical protein